MPRETTIETTQTKAFAGVVTLINWTMAPDGGTYLYFWCDRWVILTDKEVGRYLNLPGFRSGERWVLVGYSAGSDPNPKVILPGCQVKALVDCGSPPDVRAVYRVGGGR